MIRALLSLPGVRTVVDIVRRSHRRKLATALFVVLLINSVAAVGLYVQVGALLGANVEQSMTTAANAEADELTEWTEQNRFVARALAKHPVYETGDDAAIRGYLRTERAEWAEARIVDAYVIDRQNLTVEASTRRSIEGSRVGDLPWEEEFAFRDFDDVRITKPHELPEGTVVVGFITPIRRTPGHLLVVSIEAGSVFERFDHPVDGGFTRVVDSNGTVVFADDRDATLRQYRPQTLRAPSVNRGLDGESGFVDDPSYEQSPDVDGEYVVAYAPVEGTDWVVIEHAPASEAYAIIGRTRLWIGIGGAVTLLGFVGIIAVLGADVTSALSTLVRRAELIEDDTEDVSFRTRRIDEFGTLNRTLERTRDTLNRRFEKIREARETLEERSTMVSVLNRILRHNVRNDVNVIAGRAAILAERVEDEQTRAELEAIHETALQLAAISDRTQRIKHLLSEENVERTPIRLADRLPAALDAVRSSSPDATIRFHAADASLAVDAVTTFPVALADVVDQLVAHNDGSVTVDVTVTREVADGEPDAITIAVDDDGHGLPDLDVQAVGEGTETPLKHANGLALWCLEWTVNKTDGELHTDADDATLEVRFPAVAEEA